MKITSSVGICCLLPASTAFFCRAGALGGCTGMGGRVGGPGFSSAAAIDAYFPVMYFAIAAVGLAPVTRPAEQLDIGCLVAAPAGKWHDMVIFQVVKSAAALAPASVSCKHNAFC